MTDVPVLIRDWRHMIASEPVGKLETAWLFSGYARSAMRIGLERSELLEQAKQASEQYRLAAVQIANQAHESWKKTREDLKASRDHCKCDETKDLLSGMIAKAEYFIRDAEELLKRLGERA